MSNLTAITKFTTASLFLGATLDEIADYYVANADSHAEAYLGPDTDDGIRQAAAA